MDYIYMYLINVLGVRLYCVTSMPLSSGIPKAVIPNASDRELQLAEVSSNGISDIPVSNIIDLSIYGQSLYGKEDFNKTGKLVAKFMLNKTSVNPEELGSYLEGDILMPQYSLLLRNGLSSKSHRWPDGVVPFEIAGDFTENDLSIIAFAIDQYHANTCIRFKSHTTEFDYISIARENSGCWSAIGRMGGKQLVNFQTPACLMKPGTAIHELMHVLGFMHEQNRKERDDFVDIHLQNVQINALANFQKFANTIAFGVTYDYGSVMHYSSTAFSSNGQPTIVSKKPIDRNMMGQRDGFSARDIEKINRMYNCKFNSKPQEKPIQLAAAGPPHSSFIQNFASLIGNVFNGFKKFGY